MFPHSLRQWRTLKTTLSPPSLIVCYVAGMAPLYAPVAKRSVTVAGHATSIALEPPFWAALEGAAGEAGVPLNALIARVDAERLEVPEPPNLASALRLWLLARARAAPPLTPPG